MTTEAKQNHGNPDLHVEVNNTEEPIPPGSYSVNDLKTRWGIPLDYELDRVEHGKLVALDPNVPVTPKNGDHFVSHVASGSSA